MFNSLFQNIAKTGSLRSGFRKSFTAGQRVWYDFALCVFQPSQRSLVKEKSSSVWKTDALPIPTIVHALLYVRPRKQGVVCMQLNRGERPEEWRKEQ